MYSCRIVFIIVLSFIQILRVGRCVFSQGSNILRLCWVNPLHMGTEAVSSKAPIRMRNRKIRTREQL